jgi:hypothetical protein
LEKLRHDHRRVQKDSADPYAAFDFFVTAWHLLDWVYPGGRGHQNSKLRIRIKDSSPLLAVCEHVANGVKHFELDNPHLQSVDGTGLEGKFDETFDDFFDRVRLVVDLKGDAAAKFGTRVEVAKLASDVLQWWEQHLGAKS